MQNTQSKITITTEELRDHTLQAYHRGLNAGVLLALVVAGVLFLLNELTQFILALN